MNADERRFRFRVGSLALWAPMLALLFLVYSLRVEVAALRAEVAATGGQWMSVAEPREDPSGWLESLPLSDQSERCGVRPVKLDFAFPAASESLLADDWGVDWAMMIEATKLRRAAERELANVSSAGVPWEVDRGMLIDGVRIHPQVRY